MFISQCLFSLSRLFFSIAVAFVFCCSCEHHYVSVDLEDTDPVDFSDVQSPFKVLVLYPDEIIIQENALTDYENLNRQLEHKRDSIINELESYLRSSSDGISFTTIEKQIAVYTQMEAGGYFPISLSNYLYGDIVHDTWFIYPIVLCIPRKSDGSIDDLKAISELYGITYVVSISQLTIYRQDGMLRSTAHLQLFDQTTDAIELDLICSGNEKDELLEEHYADYDVLPLQKAFYNTSYIAGNEIISHAFKDFFFDEQELSLLDERKKIWTQKYPLYANQNVLKIIQQNDPSIRTQGYYQGIINSDSTKILAFFMENMDESYYQERMNFPKNQASIIENRIQVNARVVSGVLYENEWYIQELYSPEYYCENIEDEKLIYFLEFEKFDLIWNEKRDAAFDIWGIDVFEIADSSIEY